MSDDMSQRMEQVKQRLNRLTSGNENQNTSNVHRSQAVTTHAAPMRQSFQNTAPSPHSRQPPQQPQYMQPAYPQQQKQPQPSLAKSRSTRLPQSPQHPSVHDNGRMSLPSQQHASMRQQVPAPGPYGQPPMMQVPRQQQPPTTRQHQPSPSDVPSTHELQMRLQQQRAQYESAGAPRRDAPASPSPAGNPPPRHQERPRDSRQVHAPPPVPQQRREAVQPRGGSSIPQSYASSSTSSAFSEYSDQYPSVRTSLQPPPPSPFDDDRHSAPSVISDLSEEIDDAFNHKLMPPIRKNEYDFMWEGGALGLVLVEDPTHRMPIVKRVSTHMSTASKFVAEGDILVYINANQTREYKMPALMGMLKDLKKPICMRFRRARDLPEDNSPVLPPLEPAEYEFLWEEGSLGMTLGVTAQTAIPYVKRLTGKGTSPHLALVVPGDELVMINEKVCGELGFDAAMEFIKAVPKPAVLRFRQVAGPADAAHEAVDAMAHQAALMKLDEASMYCVQWSDGPFGLTVKELVTESGPVPVVTRKTGRNTCAGLRRVAIGDVLVEIGTMKVTDLGFENATKVLRNIAKPVTLKFQAVGD